MINLSLFAGPAPQPVTRRLRGYQGIAASSALASPSRARVVVMPTGTGKTVVAAEICRRHVNGRILFLAEQRRILQQAQKKIAAWCELRPDQIGFEQADHRSYGERIVCGMRQSLANPMRLDRIDQKGRPSLIIVDEAHHHAGIAGSQYRQILDRYPEAQVIGLTATPDRGDGKALAKVWGETPAYAYEIHHAIADGWLVGVVPRTPKNWEALDLSKIKKIAGDLDDQAVEGMLAAIVREQAKAIVEECSRLKTIVFCGRVATAHLLAAAIDAEMGRPCARAVDGGMDDDEKDRILDAFEASEFQFLINVGIAVEGFDSPDTEAVVLTRPFLSRSAFVQRTGRGLRPLGTIGLDSMDSAEERRAAIKASAKPHMTLVNFRYLAGKHSLVCPEDILGANYDQEEKDRAKKIREEGQAESVSDALVKSREQIAAERERRALLVQRAQARAVLDWGTFDPFAALGVGMPEERVDAGEPEERASRGMKEFLRRSGIAVPETITKRQAQKLRATLEVRKARGLAVLGQIQFLARHGITDTKNWSFERAARAMRDVQRNTIRTWRRDGRAEREA